MPHFDRFDIIEAYYLFLSHYHEGQFSIKYRRLCRLLSYFNPSPILNLNTLSENGRKIYERLAESESGTANGIPNPK